MKRNTLSRLLFSVPQIVVVLALTLPGSARSEVIIIYDNDNDRPEYSRPDRRESYNNDHHHYRNDNHYRSSPRSRHYSVTPQVPGVKSRLLLINKNRALREAEIRRYQAQQHFQGRYIDRRHSHHDNDHHYRDDSPGFNRYYRRD